MNGCRGLVLFATVAVMLGGRVANAEAQAEDSAGAEAVNAAPDVAAGTRWHEPAATILDVDFGEATGFHARWEYFHCDCGDVLIRLEQSAPDGVETGELLLVDGRVLAARGPVVAEGVDLEMLLQSPLLMLHLAFALLDQAVPEGPSTIGRQKQDFGIEEPRARFELNSSQSTAAFDAPWRVNGNVWAGAQARRRFDMTFEFTIRQPDADDATSQIRFSGGQDYRPGAFPLHDETPLDNWQIQWLSKDEAAARPAEPGLTLEALRKATKSVGSEQAEGETLTG